MTVKQPLLRYPGGKWKLADWIISHFPQHKIYVEPFGGGASVLLKKQRAEHTEFYNDLDGDVVNLFRVLRDRSQAAELIRLLKLTPFARAEFELAYEYSDDPIERARRMITRSFLGFGGTATTAQNTGFRSKSLRENSPPAKVWKNYTKRIPAIVERLQGVNFDNRDALEMIAHLDDKDALFYLDPPYVFDTRSNNADFYKHEMEDSQHARLLDLVVNLKGDVVMSGYAHPLYDEALKDWQRVVRDFYASSQSGVSARVECLWLSPGMKKRQPGLFEGIENER